jgi:hypothetical protein
MQTEPRLLDQDDVRILCQLADQPPQPQPDTLMVTSLRWVFLRYLLPLLAEWVAASC